MDVLDVLDRPVRLHDLVYLAEDDAVTIGRPDVDEYAIFPPDGAELVRRLAAGATPNEAARWYADAYHEDVDVAELLETLAELGFLRSAGDSAPAAAPVRWQRLGRAAFSRPAGAVYALIVAAAVLVMALRPGLAPHYEHVFFVGYYSVIELTLFLGQIPLMLFHESAHALAGRRLGLRSRLSISQRLGRIVLETSMDGLVAVPRRKRYLPMLAGMGADALTISVLTLIAAATGDNLAGRVCLALAFGTLLRVVWQFYFFLRTDVYYLVSTVCGCVDLHGAALKLLRNRAWRLLGSRHRHRLTDESLLHPADLRVGRWYAWLVVIGYGVSIGTLVVMVPVVWRFATGVLGRFQHSPDLVSLADSVVFVGLNLGQLLLLAYLGFRASRTRAPRKAHVLT